MYLEIRDVKKSYGSDASYIQVLKGITTSLEKGQMCVIQGTSGSGKSTLLNCIGGLDTMDVALLRSTARRFSVLNLISLPTTERKIWALSFSFITSFQI